VLLQPICILKKRNGAGLLLHLPKFPKSFLEKIYFYR